MKTLLCLAVMGLVAFSMDGVTGAVLVKRGEFREKRGGVEQAKGTTAGHVNILESWELVKETDQIEAEVGRSFGIDYELTGRPADAAVKLTVKLLHPELRNPQTGETLTVDEDVFETTIGGAHYNGYSFDEEWEMVPGKWTFQVWLGEKMLLEQGFEVRRKK